MRSRRDKALTPYLVALAAATLFHHVHNAEFLAEYPNLPASLSRASVYGAWLAGTSVGVAGLLLLHRGWRRAGLALMALNACYGLDGLVHYALAPMSAHSAVMNVSILLEAAAGLTLLLAIGACSLRARQGGLDEPKKIT